MPVDQAPAFVANPAAFIALQTIALTAIGENMPGGAFAVQNDRRMRFTLARGVGAAPPGPGDVPLLRMQPPAVGVGAVVAQPPPQPPLTTIDAYYCHAGNGGMAFDVLPRVDIPVAPGGADAHHLFTTFMNGCALVVLSAVPAGAPALAPGHWRVVHDFDHRPLAAWAAAGYTVHFAAYVDPAQPGPMPGAWAAPAIVRCYNPHNYPWQFHQPPAPPRVRAVTNFLWWDGGHWNFGSRHFHCSGPAAFDIDPPPGVVPALSSTQVCQL